MILTKDDKTMVVNSKVQQKAFLNSGWVVKTDDATIKEADPKADNVTIEEADPKTDDVTIEELEPPSSSKPAAKKKK